MAYPAVQKADTIQKPVSGLSTHMVLGTSTFKHSSGLDTHCNGFVHHQRVETEPSLSQYHNRLQPPHHVHCPLTAGALQFSQGPIWSGVGCTVTLLPTRAARLIPKMRIPSRVLPYRGSPTQLGWGEKLETVGDATAFLLELEFHHDSANSNIC